ncbi:hypothetical protein TNCV_2094351 [Trichonephila clavipes]|nr:hypothetical protein TNCV_2094351 [Trichonephila clavipes]
MQTMKVKVILAEEISIYLPDTDNESNDSEILLRKWKHARQLTSDDSEPSGIADTSSDEWSAPNQELHKVLDCLRRVWSRIVIHQQNARSDKPRPLFPNLSA